MTKQYVQIQTYDFGASLSDVTLRNPLTDAVIATADACPELSTDSGIYRAEFDETSVIAGGLYRLRAVVSGSPLNRWVTLTGEDAELAYSRMERAVALDSATSAQITTIAEVLGAAMRGDRSHSEALDLILAATVGKSSQPSGTTERFKFLDDADAFTTTFDTNGNRTAVSLS